MAIGKTNAGSGGGVNIRVVGGTTKPSTGRYGMIWVNMATAQPAYKISPVEPQDPTDGMVWVVTGAGNKLLCADKKGLLEIALIGCKVYSESTWKLVEAWLFADVWIKFGDTILYLYIKGDLCEADSGGWEPLDYSNDAHSSIRRSAPEFTNGETSCTVSLTGAGENYIRQGSVFSGKKIDVTDYTTLVMNVATLPNFGTYTIGLTDEKAHPYTFIASVKFTKSTADKLISVDISSLTGEYYVALLVDVSWSSIKSTMVFDQIYLLPGVTGAVYSIAGVYGSTRYLDE